VKRTANVLVAIVAIEHLYIPIQVFFLSCVVIAGIFGGITAKPSILFIQAAPALVALVLVYFARR
jgi:putative membrane protein